MMKKFLLTSLFLSSIAYAQPESQLFEIYENNGQNVRLEAVREGDQVLFKKTEVGDIVAEDGTVEEVAPRGPSVSQFYLAVARKEYSKLDEYLSQGAFVDSRLYAGNTALHLAAMWNDKALADILLKYNANMKLTNNKGETPLHFSCGYSNLDLFKTLVSHKSIKSISEELNKKSKNGRTCLHFAALYSTNKEMAKYLTTLSLNFDGKDENGQTPGHFAAATSNWTILTPWLGANKINLEEKDKNESSTEDYIYEKSDIFTKAKLYNYFNSTRKEEIKEKMKKIGNIGEITD